MADNQSTDVTVPAEEITIEVDGGQSLVVWQPQAIDLVHGLTLPASAPDELFDKAMAFVAPYIKVPTVSIDDFLNRRITIAGAMMHAVRVKPKMPDGSMQTYIDPNTGDEQQLQVRRDRTVIKVTAVDGKKQTPPLMIGFVSEAVAREFEELYFPRYGIGDWRRTVTVVVRRVRARLGNTYTIEPVTAAE